eukprot:14187-Heterococcus_DN1.PRE.2
MEADYPSVIAVKQLLTQQRQQPWLAELVYDQHTDLLSILSLQLGAISSERQRQRECDAPSRLGDSPRSDVSADDASALQRERAEKSGTQRCCRSCTHIGNSLVSVACKHAYETAHACATLLAQRTTMLVLSEPERVELVHSLMLALSLNTDKALEIVKQNKLIEVFAVTAATSPSAYVRSAIFELLTIVAGTAAGRTAVLKALDYAKLDRNETFRFVTVVETLSDDEAGITAQ